MRKKIAIFLVAILTISQINYLSFTTTTDDYYLKSQIVKGVITPEEAYSKANAISKSDPSVSSTNNSISLNNYQLYSNKTITKYGVQFEELLYKKKSKNHVGILSTTPENGDFKIVISKGSISGKDWTNGSVSGYGAYILTEGVFKATNIITGLTIKNSVVGLLTGDLLSKLQENFKGEGNTYTCTRTVSKWGQIYKNGSWVDYYYGTQEELKWGYIIYIYNKKPNGIGDGSVIRSYSVQFDNESNNPIYVKYTHCFRDNNIVFQYANAQYTSNQYIYRDISRPTDVIYSTDWRTGINPCY